MRCISARNFSRRVRLFVIAYLALAKLRWVMVVLGCGSMRPRTHVQWQSGELISESEGIHETGSTAVLVNIEDSQVRWSGVS